MSKQQLQGTEEAVRLTLSKRHVQLLMAQSALAQGCLRLPETAEDCAAISCYPKRLLSTSCMRMRGDQWILILRHIAQV
jgi:hypothetical protein